MTSGGTSEQAGGESCLAGVSVQCDGVVTCTGEQQGSLACPVVVPPVVDRPGVQIVDVVDEDDSDRARGTASHAVRTSP